MKYKSIEKEGKLSEVQLMDIEQVRQGKNSANKDFGLMFILTISIKTHCGL